MKSRANIHQRSRRVGRQIGPNPVYRKGNASFIATVIPIRGFSSRFKSRIPTKTRLTFDFFFFAVRGDIHANRASRRAARRAERRQDVERQRVGGDKPGKLGH